MYPAEHSLTSPRTAMRYPSPVVWYEIVIAGEVDVNVVVPLACCTANCTVSSAIVSPPMARR